ncbi:regulatory protein RecX [Ruminococcus sp.]|uniref:regulatory protein RecX n=1 Tax=Ruminococcus sp. TaxID=41978 RepID=UPI0025F2178D|nr:regulatory protein RecX [Ruminococcus sp.]MBQ8967773.1 regulatory protein RecX [Ruminococcus sp.]
MLKITNVSRYKGMTCMIEFEDRDTEFLNQEIVSRYNLKAGMSLPLSAWEDIKADEEYRKARERALYLLDYRDYSYVELFHKLEKNYSEDTCYRVMDKMVEMGTINDRRYAEGLARHYVEVKHFGSRRAYQEMRGKGLTGEVIKLALQVYDEDEETTWYDRLYELVEKKYLRYLEDEKGINRVKNALVRYGYSYDLIKEVLRDIGEEYGEED